ncbi:MAG: ABC transporter permease [Actinomycetota bacterium]
MTGVRAPWLMVERNVVWYRRSPMVLLSALFEPFIFLFGLGIGLGRIVGDVEWYGETLTYAEFVAPALVASSAMNGALFEMSFNFYFKLKESKTFEAILATPLSLRNVFDGELAWATVRGGLYSLAFVIALWAMGLLASAWSLLIAPVALLIGLAFAGLASYATTWVRQWQDFDLFILVTQPLFVLSTTFFAIDVYPSWAHPLVQLTPLYHGVDLVRDLARGTVDAASWLSVAYLVAVTVITRLLTVRRLSAMLHT